MNTVDPLDERLGVFPIQRLPPEILAEIFIFCLSTNSAAINHAPLLLCYICSSWRALAISTPVLWADLNLRFNSFISSNTQAIVDGIHTWLGRSGDLPLTIRLFYKHERSFNAALLVCDALSKYTSRWKSVDVALPEMVFDSWPNLHAVPLLHTLRIRHPFRVIPFTSAPRLARVHLCSMHSAVMLQTPWHQLVELAITKWLSNGVVLTLLAWCPLLDSIEARLSGVANFMSKLGAKSPPVEHPILRNINFCFEYNDYTIFESLVVPGLKSLSICNDTKLESRSRLYSNPLGLMNRSNCKLRELCLVRIFFAQDRLIEYLEHKSCQTLTSLCIENYGCSHDGFDELLLRLTHVDDKSEDSLCPELTHLTFTYCYRDNTSTGVLGRMILSRSMKTERNRLGSIELFIDDSCKLAETDQALLKRAEENGLKLCINNGIKPRCIKDE